MTREFPVFGPARGALDYAGLRYNPCNDLIFPSVIPTAGLARPLGRYYMYYAPHNPPGGVCLAWSDHPAGPWREYEANPVIPSCWPPHYDVSHVSSPHAFRSPTEGRLLLYFHGDNRATRLAASADGIAFSYEGVMVTPDMFDGIRYSTYARVCEHTLPSRGNRFLMLLMGHGDSGCRIYMAWSDDARRWTCRREMLIAPDPGAGLENLCSPWFFPWQGRCYVLYHGDAPGVLTNVYATEVGADFEMNRFAGLFYSRHAVSPNNERASDPCLLEADGSLYLYVSVGPRLNQKIAVAKAAGAGTL